MEILSVVLPSSKLAVRNRLKRHRNSLGQSSRHVFQTIDEVSCPLRHESVSNSLVEAKSTQ